MSIISCALDSHAMYVHLYERTSSRHFSKKKTQRRFPFVRRSQPKPKKGQFKGGKFGLSQCFNFGLLIFAKGMMVAATNVSYSSSLKVSTIEQEGGLLLFVCD